MKPSSSTRVRFGAFELDLTTGELRSREGGNIQVLLREQGFQVLTMLVEHRGKIVTRGEIKKKLWPNDTIVDFDHSINATIKTLRRTLGDSADSPQYIETLARRGYRLMMAAEWLESTAGIPPGEGPCAPVFPVSSGLIGKKVSHYRVLEAIGAGGMGMVYKAEDLKLGRRVALKFLPEEVASDALALQRFEREAQTASALNHPNICTIYEIEEHEGQPFIAMELLEGHTLRQRIAAAETKPLPLAEVFAIAMQICDGLQAAHDMGIIHRDVKPANIFLTRQGPVKILDFGLAKLAASRPAGEKDESEVSTETAPPSPSSDQSLPRQTEHVHITLTSTGTAAGTAAYMSPEQVRKEELDGRSDLFSFGMILYEMTTGRCAFIGATVAEIHHAILHQTPAPVRDLNTAAPRGLDSAISKALEKDREKRYQSAAELRKDLARAGKQKHWRKAALTSALALILVAAGYFSWRHFRPGTPPGPEKTMLAVLPFQNLTGDPNKEYLADGLTEETISQLGRLNPQQLGVIARTSVMGYKHKDVRLDQIGRDLSVQYVLESSLRQSGDHLRLTAQLIQVKDQTHLWAQDYDYAAKDILNVEDEVAKSVAREIRVRLTSQQEDLARSRPVNPEAFDAYLQGYHFFQGTSGKDADMAAKYFERATQLDPSYALAWAWLSRARNWQANDGLIPMEEGKRLAREAVERALALDPNLAVAHAQMGRMKQQVDYDWSGANASFQRAVALEPGNPEYISMAAIAAACFGRFDEALRLHRQAIDLDPLNAHSWGTLAETEVMMGQLDQAAADSKKALEVNPDYDSISIDLSRIYLLQGRPQDALRESERVRSDAYRVPLYALTYYALGRKNESDAALQELIMKYHASEAFEIAMVYAFRNQPNEAFEWLDRAYAQRDPSLGCTKGEPLLKSLHNDPRYAAFLQKLKLPN